MTVPPVVLARLWQASLNAQREAIAAWLEDKAANYPIAAFPPLADDWHQAEGAAIRLAYLNTAAELRAGRP